MLSRTLLCLAVISASTPLLADTVWLKNGDRLTGKIKVFDGGKLLIQTSYAGAIPVDWKQVKTLESDQELLVKQDAYSGEKAKSLKAADDGKVVLANGEAPKTVELASIQQILKPKPVVEDLVWKGNVVSSTHAGLNRNFTTAHAPGDGFRAGPERRIQPTLTGQRIDHAALSGFRQQAQRAVEVGLAAAVGAGDQVQPTQRDHQFIDRAVIGHREGFEHPKLVLHGRPVCLIVAAKVCPPVGARLAREGVSSDTPRYRSSRASLVPTAAGR